MLVPLPTVSWGHRLPLVTSLPLHRGAHPPTLNSSVSHTGIFWMSEGQEVVLGEGKRGFSMKSHEPRSKTTAVWPPPCSETAR